MAIGPVEYAIIEFPGSRFNGGIAPALGELIESGKIRLLDLVFITKDAEGDVLIVEFDEHDDLAAFGELDGEVGGLLTPEDLAHAADGIQPGSSAALLIWEDTWALPLVESIRDSGGVLIEGMRIPHELIEAALGELESA